MISMVDDLHFLKEWTVCQWHVRFDTLTRSIKDYPGLSIIRLSACKFVKCLAVTRRCLSTGINYGTIQQLPANQLQLKCKQHNSTAMANQPQQTCF